MRNKSDLPGMQSLTCVISRARLQRNKEVQYIYTGVYIWYGKYGRCSTSTLYMYSTYPHLYCRVRKGRCFNEGRGCGGGEGGVNMDASTRKKVRMYVHTYIRNAGDATLCGHICTLRQVLFFVHIQWYFKI